MAKGLQEKVWPLLAAGTIKPIIYKTFPLADAAGAHAELERADHVGKVMLTILGRRGEQRRLRRSGANLNCARGCGRDRRRLVAA